MLSTIATAVTRTTVGVVVAGAVPATGLVVAKDKAVPRATDRRPG